MKKKYWEKTKIINFDSLEREFEFVYTNNLRKARKKRNEKLGKAKYKISKTVDGLWCENEDKNTVALFIEKRASLGVISHEAYHAVRSLFRSIGVEEHDEELTAYHLGYIVDQIYKIINDKKD